VEVTMSEPEQQKNTHNQPAEAVSQLPRRACTQQLTQNQAQVERANMNQLSL
jgi:hypothetical protein